MLKYKPRVISSSCDCKPFDILSHNRLKVLPRTEKHCCDTCFNRYDNLVGLNYVELCVTAVKGTGVYSPLPHDQHDLIIELYGTILPKLPRYCRPFVNIDEKLIVSYYNVTFIPSPDSMAHKLNHSCTPNSKIIYIKDEGIPRFILKAMKEIQPYEEITIDYSLLDLTEYSVGVCLCFSPNCRGAIGVPNQSNIYTRRMNAQRRFNRNYAKPRHVIPNWAHSADNSLKSLPV